MYPTPSLLLVLLASLFPLLHAHPATTSSSHLNPQPQQKLVNLPIPPPAQNQIILKKLDSGHPNAPPQSRIILRGGAGGRGSGVFVPASANVKNERGMVIRISPSPRSLGSGSESLGRHRQEGYRGGWGSMPLE